eukprot:3064016-Lingulodinium_polyedra.AAC.1
MHCAKCGPPSGACWSELGAEAGRAETAADPSEAPSGGVGGGEAAATATSGASASRSNAFDAAVAAAQDHVGLLEQYAELGPVPHTLQRVPRQLRK